MPAAIRQPPSWLFIYQVVFSVKPIKSQGLEPLHQSRHGYGTHLFALMTEGRKNTGHTQHTADLAKKITIVITGCINQTLICSINLDTMM